MNKADLIQQMTAKSGLTKKDSEAALEAVISTVEETLVKGDKLVLVGFGTFETKSRAARKGRNPKTKEAIDIPACKVPAFKVGKGLKDKVNV